MGGKRLLKSAGSSDHDSERKQRTKKWTTSKRLLWLDAVVAIVVTAAVIIGEFTGHDMTVSGIVAGLWDGQFATALAFYLWKSKNENRSKHAMELVRELADKYGIDGAARIAEIVLKD